MLYLKDIDVSGKKVLIRVDYNVPLDGTRVTDDTRIRESLPTLRHILGAGGAIVLCCHLGQPKGEAKPEFSLAPVAAHLAGLLGVSVPLAEDCVGPDVQAKIAALRPGEVLMLQNLRFHKAETSKDPAERMAFAKQLVAGLDLYVSDAFGVAHRPNASVTEAPLAAPKACAGFLMEKEWTYLHGALSNPKRPFVAISGGSKVSSKLALLKNLLGKVDHLIIGGAMANTFRLAQGIDMGASLVEPDLVGEAKAILDAAADSLTHIHLPPDLVLAESFKSDKAAVASHTGPVPAGLMALDIGPASVEAFAYVLKGAGTVVWNGPMGAFENPAFAAGSIGMAKAIVACGALSIAGGGDTDAVVHAAGLGDKFSFISTGGGSFLEFLEGKELPGFKALEEAARK